MGTNWNFGPHLNDYRLDGKTALITGGAQGIGEACAHALIESGAIVVITGRDESKLAKVCAELSQKGQSSYFVADLANISDVEALYKNVTDKFSMVDILINNAGIGQWKSALDISYDEWDLMIRTNLTSAFFMSQKFGKHMINSRYGKVVNISSISGLIVNSEHDHAHYGTSKAGLIHLTKSLAAEWAKFGVRVNCITPGYTSTKMLTELLLTPEGAKIGKRINELTPAGKMATVTDISQGVLFLSVPASDYITGQILSIDGGYTLL
jgi:NAD(P)-dependent dehydrogenase (short-subunit alcohol dehydrogenase family)